MANGNSGRNLHFVWLSPLLALFVGLACGYAKPELAAFGAGLGVLANLVAAWLIWRPRLPDETYAERVRLRLGIGPWAG
jgi:hypothetical protein